MFLPWSSFCQEAELFLQVPGEDRFPQQASRGPVSHPVSHIPSGRPRWPGSRERGQWSGGLYVEGRCWKLLPSVPSQFVIAEVSLVLSMKEISWWRLSLEEELIHLSFVKPLCGLRPARNSVSLLCQERWCSATSRDYACFVF